MERRSGTEYHVASRRAAAAAAAASATSAAPSSSHPATSSSVYHNKERSSKTSRCEDGNHDDELKRYRDKQQQQQQHGENLSSNHVSRHHNQHHQHQQQDQQQQQQQQHQPHHRSSSRTRNTTTPVSSTTSSSRETLRGKSTRSAGGSVGNSSSSNINNSYNAYSEQDSNHVSHSRRSTRSSDRDYERHNNQPANSQRSSRSRNYDEYYDDIDASSMRSSRHNSSSVRGEYSAGSSDTISVRGGRSESQERVAGDEEANYYQRSRSDSTRRHRDGNTGSGNNTHRRSQSRQRLDHQESIETPRGHRDRTEQPTNGYERDKKDQVGGEERATRESHSSRRSRSKDVNIERNDPISTASRTSTTKGNSSEEQNSENRRRTGSIKSERHDADYNHQRGSSSRRRQLAETDINTEQVSNRRGYDEGNQKVLHEAEIYPEPDPRRKEVKADRVTSSRSRRSSSSQNLENQDDVDFRRRAASQHRASQEYVGPSRRNNGESDHQRQGTSRRLSRNNSFADENVKEKMSPSSYVYADRYHSTPKERRRRENGTTGGEMHPSESRQSMREDGRRRGDYTGRNEMYSSESRHSNIAHDQFYDVSTIDRRSYCHHRGSENESRYYDTSYSSRRRRSVSSYDEPEIPHTHHIRRDNSLSNRSSSSRSNHDTGFHSSASSPRREESMSRFSSDISPCRYQDEDSNRQSGYESTKNRRRSRNVSSNNNSLDVPQAPLRKDRSLSSSGRGDSSFEENGQEPEMKKNDVSDLKDNDISKTDQGTINHTMCNGDIPHVERENDISIRSEGNTAAQTEKSITMTQQEESPRTECTSSTSTLRGGGVHNMNSKPSFVGSISSLLSRDQTGSSERSFSIGSMGEKWRKIRQGMAPDQGSTSSFASDTASLFSSAASRFMNSLPKVPNSFPKAFTPNTSQPPSGTSKSNMDIHIPDPSHTARLPQSATAKDITKSPPNSNISPSTQSIKSAIHNSKSPTINNNNNNTKSGFDGVTDTLSPRPSLASTNISIHTKAASAYISNKQNDVEEEEEDDDDLLTPTSEESGQMTPPPMDTDMKRRSKEVDGELTSFLPAEMSRREEKFHDAARMNDAVAIRTILKEKVNINCRNSLDRTALHWAAANGNLAALEALTDGGADLEAKDKYGMRAILWAAWFGHIPVLQALVNAGANTKIANKQGLGVLHCAAENNHAAVIAFIFESLEPHNVNQTDKNDRTALHLAAEGGHVQTVDVLLQAQADIHKKNKAGKTCVHLAAQRGHADVLKILLLQGVEVDDRDVDGKTALHLASEGGHKDIVDLLLDYTANPNSETIKEITPLHMAAVEGHVEVCRSLVKYGCNVNSQNFGNTALHLAANANHKDVARVLVDAKCETDLPNSRLQTPLHIAVESGHLEVVQTLLAGGASLEAREKSGKSALQLAARGNYVSVVDMLIKAERYYAIARDYHDNDVGYVDPDTYLRNASHPNATHMKEVLWKLATKQLKPTDWKKLAYFWHFTPEHIKAIEQEYTGTMSYKDHGYRLLLIWLHGVRKDENVLKLLFEALVGIEKRHLAESIRRKANMVAEKDKPCSPSVCAVS